MLILFVEWIEDIRRNSDEKICIVLVGTKGDRTDYRVVEDNKAKQLAAQLEIPYFETSSKNGQRVNEVFMHLTNEIIETQLLYKVRL